MIWQVHFLKRGEFLFHICASCFWICPVFPCCVWERIFQNMSSSEYSDHFSIANIPFGVASSEIHPNSQCVTRLENSVIFLVELQKSGIFSSIKGLPEGIFGKPSLNDFAALPRSIHREVRKVLQETLQRTLPAEFSEDISAVTLHLPMTVGGFTGTFRDSYWYVSMLGIRQTVDLTRTRFFMQCTPCS